MSISLEVMIAWRYLRARKTEGFISVISGFSFLGIALGVATLIVVMSVMNGFRTELLDRILGINAHVSVMNRGGNIRQYDDLVETLKQVDKVTLAAPVVQGQVLATAYERHAGAFVRGMRADDIRDKTLIAENIVEGSIDAFAESPSVIIGMRMAEQLGVGTGDILTLISPDTIRTIAGPIPAIKEYEIAAIFDVGMYEYDSTGVFLNLKEAQLYFDKEGSADTIELTLEHPREVVEVNGYLRQTMPPQFVTVDWQEVNAHYFHSLKVERTVMFFILTLIILIAAFNIISSLIMLVTDKTRNIAILRTMGMSRGSIIRIFVMTGAIIGVVGTLLGVALGLSFALNIESIRQLLESLTGQELFAAEVYFLSQLPAEVQSEDTIKVVLMSLGLSFLATIYPAWKASKIHPASGVRYE